MSGEITSSTFKDYKIVVDNNAQNCIKANHDKKELHVSKDINLKFTDDGNLFTEFTNPEIAQKAGCSMIISEPAYFDQCVQKNGEYELSGSLVTFNGTDGDDILTLKEVTNSKINMGNGNDKVFVEGSSPQSRFFNNIIKTENGNDLVNVSGDFKYFINNQFYLGKGSDYFSASINPDDDAQTYAEFESKIPKYGSAVAKNEVYAIDGYTKDGDKKGWFECDIFASKTYSANQLFKYNFSTGEMSGLDGFQLYKFKPEPKQVFIIEPKVAQPVQKDKTKRQITREDYQTSYFANSFLAWFGVKGAQEGAFKTLDDYVKSMTK